MQTPVWGTRFHTRGSEGWRSSPRGRLGAWQPYYAPAIAAGVVFVVLLAALAYNALPRLVSPRPETQAGGQAPSGSVQGPAPGAAAPSRPADSGVGPQAAPAPAGPAADQAQGPGASVRAGGDVGVGAAGGPAGTRPTSTPDELWQTAERDPDEPLSSTAGGAIAVSNPQETDVLVRTVGPTVRVFLVSPGGRGQVAVVPGRYTIRYVFADDTQVYEGDPFTVKEPTESGFGTEYHGKEVTLVRVPDGNYGSRPVPGGL